MTRQVCGVRWALSPSTRHWFEARYAPTCSFPPPPPPYDFVSSKPDGLDAVLGEGGAGLSGGQRQRLTIARALVRRPGILILDDSSSALDYATDAALRRSLRQLDFDPTVFIVSQRVSSVRGADRIIVLDDGSVAGIGTHDELLENCLVYKEICASQHADWEVSVNG